MPEPMYTVVPNKLGPLLAKIRDVGIPSTVNKQWLDSIGFTSSNDRPLIGVLKRLGFVAASGSPTNIWTQYRGSNHRQVLGDAIRQAYSELYATYSNAESRSDAEISDVFRTLSTTSGDVVSRMVSTFKKLAEHATFTTADLGTSVADGERETVRTADANGTSQSGIATGPHRQAFAIHIDVQVHISPDSSPDQIDAIFSSMAKHFPTGPS